MKGDGRSSGGGGGGGVGRGGRGKQQLSGAYGDIAQVATERGRGAVISPAVAQEYTRPRHVAAALAIDFMGFGERPLPEWREILSQLFIPCKAVRYSFLIRRFLIHTNNTSSSNPPI
jgi:hypothetical protein